MTRRGQSINPHIKFLKGYGFSVNVKDNKIILKNAYDPFKESESEEWFIKQMPYEKIVLCGKGYVSTEALSLLSEHNKNVILLDTYGKPITYMNPVYHGDGFASANYRIGQYDTIRDSAKRQYLSGQIVKAKLESQIRFLEMTNNVQVQEGIKKLRSSQGDEAVASRIYFENYVKLIDKKYGFTKRNSLKISKQNASDIINALLNYGYTVLAGEISSYINSIGLDAYYGFLHINKRGFQSLVYDMIEPFRWLVDYTVWKFSSQRSANRILKKQYAYTREGLVVMEYDLTKGFLESLQRTFQKERRYEYRHGAKTKDGLKWCQEITIAKIAVQNLADFCTGKKSTFYV